MTTIVSTLRDADGNVRAFVDGNTQETLLRYNPLVLEDDFVGGGHTAGVPVFGSPVAGYPWVKRIVGAGLPTVAIQTNGAGGIMQCALTATSEKQDAVLYNNDQHTFDATKNLVFEARAAMGVLPSAAQVEMVFGLQSPWIDGPDNAAFYLQFQALGSGLINCRSKDGVTTTSVSSGVTLVANAYRVFRIDASILTDVAFFIDGTRVNPINSMSFAATGANAVLQLYASVYKASGAGVGTLNLDTMSVATDRV